MQTNTTNLHNQLKSELQKETPDFGKVLQIILPNKDLLKKPIDNDGRYVLHFACMTMAPPNIVAEIINGNTSAVQQKDKYGHYPLHLACRFNQSESVIQFLINEYPLAVQQKDNDNVRYYPLHMACRYNQSESVIKLLVKEHPLAVKEKDKNGRYPLHIACKTNASIKIIQFLVTQWNNALVTNDNNGKTPLDYAKQPWGSHAPNKETVQWLEDFNDHIQWLEDFLNNDTPETFLTVSFSDIRSGLKQIMEGHTIEPISVSVDYVNAIKTDTFLGEGCFGTVYEGFDNVIDKKFAIKVLNLKILQGALPVVIESMIKSFEVEAMVCQPNNNQLLFLLGAIIEIMF
jgi:Ankyrin repeats (3 copies)/Ankyrin repeat